MVSLLIWDIGFTKPSDVPAPLWVLFDPPLTHKAGRWNTGHLQFPGLPRSSWSVQKVKQMSSRSSGRSTKSNKKWTGSEPDRTGSMGLGWGWGKRFPGGVKLTLSHDNYTQVLRVKRHAPFPSCSPFIPRNSGRVWKAHNFWTRTNFHFFPERLLGDSSFCTLRFSIVCSLFLLFQNDHTELGEIKPLPL